MSPQKFTSLLIMISGVCQDMATRTNASPDDILAGEINQLADNLADFADILRTYTGADRRPPRDGAE